jgi:acetyltransferase-like isoleucine patch superfamily enzyme
MYGPTETTIWSTLARIESPEAPIRIGRPIANTRVRIVDDALLPVADGETGELLIAGEGLARGYRNRFELTRERFVTLAAPNGEGEERFYRTGDLARLLPEGSLECLGRIDHQIKLRGFRIEPAEIESVLEDHHLIAEAVVLAREDVPGDRRLVAYVVCTDEADDAVLAAELRDLARSRLPNYMVPAQFVRIPILPLTGNGKIDRLALPAPSTGGARRIVGRAPSGEVELTLAAAWESALKMTPVGAEENFFELGGNSLLMHQIRGELQESLDRKIAMVELFGNPTVASFADHLMGASDGAHTTVEDRGVYGKGDPHALSLLVRRFLIPRSLLSLYYFWKFRARISPRAEVELSPNLIFGKKTTVGSFTKIKADKGPLVIGERSSFANGCFIGSGPAGLRIGRNLVCGPNVTIVPSNYVFEDKDVHLADQGHTSKGIRIGNDVWIGAGSTILDGAEIGDNTVIVAGSVVDGRFPSGSMLRGNPAEIVARR